MTLETVTRLKVIMAQREYSALLQAAERTLRTPDAEARLIIRRELERRGLLPVGGVGEVLGLADEVSYEQ